MVAGNGFWTDIGLRDIGLGLGLLDTWVLPASTPCGSENESTCEPVGHWYLPGASWIDPPGTATAVPADPIPYTWAMLEADGSVSDLIVAYNDANGAAISFNSA